MKDIAIKVLKNAIESTVPLYLDMAKKGVSQEGGFAPCRLSVNIPHTENRMLYSTEEDLVKKGESRRFSMGVLREGTDRLISNYLLCGTREEIFAFLESEEGKLKIFEAVVSLSDKTDDFWD